MQDDSHGAYKPMTSHDIQKRGGFQMLYKKKSFLERPEVVAVLHEVKSAIVEDCFPIQIGIGTALSFDLSPSLSKNSCWFRADMHCLLQSKQDSVTLFSDVFLPTKDSSCESFHPLVPNT